MKTATARKFSGTGVAIVTPFRSDGSVDFKALEKLINHITQNGVNYIVALGTTGESVTLNKEEKTAVINFVKETKDENVPLIIGIGGNNTAEIINSISCTDFDGVDAILSVAPYYNKPTQEGLYEHYKTIASASPVPLVLYNVPGRTGVNIEAETTLKLAKHRNIWAIKEASGNFIQIMEILKHKPKDFEVISGDDAISLPLISTGVSGVISVTANAFPKEFSSMIKFALEGDFNEAININNRLLELYKYLFIDGNPGGIKAALKLLKITEKYVRLPLVPVSKQTYQKIDELIAGIKKK